ncbi:MAG: Diguanylate phosphodiesterase domain [Cyanobacteria bacterium RYN_339]|nr:Diguanylate phosphodiesterase domain [Cyanobacteria bacterium RYN_339]
MWLPPETPLEPTASALLAANGKVDVLDEQHALALWLGAGDFGELAEILDKHLGASGLANVRAVYMEGNASPSWRDLAHARPLGDYVAAQRALWLLELVENNRLTSHFQPITYAQDTSRVFAQEALLRAVDSDGKLVPPFRMFGAARAAGMLDMLDGHARSTALREAVRHNLHHRIFINLNPASIGDPAALDSTLELVRTLGLKREQVVFELVESDHGVSGASLEALRAYFTAEGFKLALDDLGSGYSSLNLIHRLRPDYIKLDMDLIRDVHEDPYKARITSKILELAQDLGIETIAEGVETLGELRWLRARGATYLQGYLIAKPTSPPNLAPAQIASEDEDIVLESTVPVPITTKTVA